MSRAEQILAEFTGAVPKPMSLGVKATCAVFVEPEEISWLWPGRIPFGKLTLLSGDPGLGKSFLTLDIAARVSAGYGWPDGEPGCEPGVVLIANAEDGMADTMIPRLNAAGADFGNIYLIEAAKDGDKEYPLSLEEHWRLKGAVEHYHAKLLILDPLSAFLGDIDSHKDSQVRAVLAPLARLAEETRAAVLVVAHLNKSQQTAAIYRTGGSVAFVAAARAVHVLAADRQNTSRRIFAPLKVNIGPPAPALAFTIEASTELPIEAARLVWEAKPVDASAEELLAPEPPRPRGPRPENLERAKDFIQERLQDVPDPQPVEAIIQAAKHAGISERTLRRAADDLGVVHTRSKTFPPRSYWSLNLAETADCPNTLGNLAKSTKPLAEKGFNDSANLAETASLNNSETENRERFGL